MTKPMMVTLPFVLLLLDYWPLGRLQLDVAKQTEKPARQVPTKWSLFVEKLPIVRVDPR